MEFVSPPKNIKYDDCYFYHVMDIPDIGLTSGQWDLRMGIDTYLGNYIFKNKRVLELGPASGYLTFEIEKRGGELVCIEVPEDPGWDFVPYPDKKISSFFPERKEIMRKLKNSFWFAHQAYNSKAKLSYDNIYQLSDSSGQFDVALLASILLHTSNPLKIIHECAKKADNIIIVDLYKQELEGQPVCKLNPNANNASWDTWWFFSTDFFKQFLEVLGFTHIEITYHSQIYMNAPSHPLFTMVALR